ncbi:hypothetical protein [Paraburkholderia caribensis]|uniref:hypothetical protein n=1 Tax=Paraburkholderia caribensis TaxID=75105 RepID=UPI0034D3375E
MRTEVIEHFLYVLKEMGEDEFNVLRLSASRFAIEAGISRQALHKSYPEITHALSVLAKGFQRPAAPDHELQQRLNEMQEELTTVRRRLQGSVKQSHDMAIQVMQLEKRLARRRAKVVDIRAAREVDEEQ